MEKKVSRRFHISNKTCLLGHGRLQFCDFGLTKTRRKEPFVCHSMLTSGCSAILTPNSICNHCLSSYLDVYLDVLQLSSFKLRDTLTCKLGST